MQAAAGTRALHFGRCMSARMPNLPPASPRAHVARQAEQRLAASARRHLRLATAGAAGNGAGGLSSHALLQKALDFESVLVQKDATALDALLAPSAVLHKDSISLQDDVEGAEAIKRYYAGYVKGWEEQHTPIDVALNEAARSVFVLSVETDVRPKEASGQAGQPSQCAGIFKYIFDGEGKVTDIYFIRQLGKDELVRKFKNAKLQSLDGAAYEARDLLNEFAGEAVVGGRLVDVTPADPQRVQQVHRAAAAYSDLYGANSWPQDQAEVEALFEPNVASTDLLFGGEKRGARDVAAAIESVSKAYRSSDHQHDIAVTPDGNKAFIHWSNRGTLQSEGAGATKDNLKGFTFLKFAPEGAISHVLGFRQPTSAERQTLFGEQPTPA